MSRHFQFRRKSLSGNWKTNIGQSLLEEVPVSGHHKQWIDEVICRDASKFCMSLIQIFWPYLLGFHDVWWLGYLFFRGRGRQG